MAISSWLSPQPQLSGVFQPTGGGTYRLQTSIGISNTSLTLSSFKEPTSNIPYTMTYMGSDIAYGTIDPSVNGKSEFVSFTGITQNGDGTATLTGLKRGLTRTNGCVASTTLAQTHAGQSIFILSNSNCFYSEFAERRSNELIPGAWTASSTNPWKYDNAFVVASTSQQIVPASWIYNNFVNTSVNQTINAVKTFSATTTLSNGALLGYGIDSNSNALAVANKKYVDDLAFAGAPDANTTTKGIVEEATSAEIASGASTGGTGAKLFMTPSTFLASSLKSLNYRGLATTTVTTYISTTTAMTTGETLMIIANGNYLCSGTPSVYNLYIKPPLNATTTLDTQVCGDGTGRASSITFLGTWTATSTGDYIVSTSNSAGYQTNFMLLKFKN